MIRDWRGQWSDQSPFGNTGFPKLQKMTQISQKITNYLDNHVIILMVIFSISLEIEELMTSSTDSS